MGKRLVVGLGNPGPQYENTWHNLGFKVVRALAGRLRASLSKKNDALTTTVSFLGDDVTLLLPQSYMNLSGKAVRAIANRERIEDQDILIVFDDHDLPRGLLRFRKSGGDGGHRGLRSVINEMNSEAIPRLRIGIRDDSVDEEVGGYDDLADRVLDQLTADELDHFELIAKGGSEAVVEWLRNGIKLAMNRQNNRQILSREAEAAEKARKDAEKKRKKAEREALKEKTNKETDIVSDSHDDDRNSGGSKE